MAITRYAGDRFTIAAGETKPTGVLDGGYLIDTGNLTQFVKRTVGGASQWTQLAGGGGGGGSPGGSNTQVQFNNNGAFGGNANLTFDGSKLAVNDLALSGIIYDSNNSIGNGGMVLTNEGTTGVNWKSIESVLSGVGGSGVANYVARWSDEDTLTTGIIYDNASKVGISTASPQAELHIYAGTTAGDHLLVESTNTAAGDAPDLVLYRNSPSPANSDDLGIIRFRGKNNGTDTGFEENKVIYADIEAEITSVVSGAEGAALKFYTQDNGSLASRMVITGANVGIGTATPAVPLHITKSTVGDNEVPEVIRLSTLNSASPSWSTTDGLCIGAEMKKANGTTITKQPIRFRYDGGDMATTLEEGKVGIGTDAPASKLHVYGSNAETTIAKIDGSLRMGVLNSYIKGPNDYKLLRFTNAGLVYNEDGAAALDFRMEGDTDINLFFSDASADKIGIGTNAPAAKLDLRSSDSVVAYIIRPSASPTVHIGSSTSAGAQLGYIHANDYAFFGHDAAFNAIVVNSSGSVGIGSTDPEEIVNVASAGAVTPGVINDLYSATTTRFPWIGLRKSGSNTKGTVAATEDGDILGKIVFKGVDSGSSFFRESASIIATASGAPDADTQPGMLQFATSNTTSNSVKMTITSSGFVGIGTVTPAYSLQANGTNGGIIAVTRTTANTTGTIGHFRFGADLANVKGIQDGAADSARLEFETQATGGSVATRMKISSAGAIQFNTYGSGTHTGTSAYKLSVDSSGNIIETSIGAGAVDGSGTANTIARWTDSDTIGDSLITVPSNTSVKINASGADAVRSLRIDGTNGSSEIAGFILENDGANAKVNLKYNIGNGTPTTKVTLNHLGNVGINTTSPAAELHAHGTTLTGRTSGDTGSYVVNSYDLIVSNGGSGTVVLLYNDAGAFQSSLIKYDTNCLKLGLNSSNSTNAISTATAVNVGSVGVGIGTVTPGALLEVYAASSLVATHVKSGTVISRLTANSTASDGVVGTSSAHDFLIQRAGSTRITLSGSSVVVNDTGEDIDFRVEGDTDTNLIRTDAANERVGIGTNAPSSKLHVVLDSSATNTPTDVLRLGHTSTGSTAVGFGALIRFDGERTGSTVDGMGRLGFVADVMTASRVDGAFIVQTGADGTYTERMRITSTGKVGIGTNVPAERLHVYKSGTDTPLRVETTGHVGVELKGGTSNDIYFLLADTSTNAKIGWDHSATALKFNASASFSDNHLVVKSTGVGIGTDNPAALLNLFKTGANDAVSSAIYLQRAAGNYGAAILQVGNGSSGSEKLMFTAGHNSDPMSISNTKMTIQQDGNVGIGTTAPGQLLHVYKAGVLEPNFQSTTGRVGLQLNAGAAGDVSWILYSGYPAAGDFNIRESGVANHFVIKKTTGSVGIGTDAPDGKLHVTNTTYIDVATNTGTASALIWRRLDKTIVGRIVADTTNLKTQIWDNNSAVVTIGSDQVGIGTDAPDSLLMVYKSGADSIIHVRGAAGGGDARVRINGYESSELYIDRNNVGRFAFRRTTGTDDLSLLKLNDNYTDNSTIMFWDYSSGSVGIGTNAPSEVLEVKGNITIRGETNNRLKIANDSNNNWAEIGNDGATGENTLEFFTGSSSTSSLSLTNGGYAAFAYASQVRLTLGSTGTAGTNNANWIRSNGANLEFNAASGDFNWEVGGVHKMRLTDTGFLGIGLGAGSDPVYSIQANGTNGGIIGVTRTSGSTTGTLGHVRFGNTNVDSDLANIKGVQDGATDSARLEFETQAAGGSATARLTIKSDGVVDINSAKLKINGGSGTDGQVLTTDGAGGIAWETSPGAGSVDGSGTANYVAKWSDSDTIANSVLRDDGNRLAVGAAPSLGAGILHLKDVTSNQAKVTLESANAYNSWINFSAASNEMSIGYDKSTVGGFVFSNSDTIASNIRMVILSGGSVGIGTAAPSSLLDVEGAAAAVNIISSSGSTASIVIGRSVDTQAKITSGDTAAHDFNIYTGGSRRVTILNDGNVGIGTDAPANIFHVKRDVDDFVTKLENDGNSTSSDGLWLDTRWNTASNTVLKVTSNSGSADYLYIKGDGKVGIGTATPSTKFQVHSGDILITSGKQLISTNSYTQAPPAMLTTQGPSTGATSLGTGTWGIMLGPQHARSTVANTYYPGIAFNHLLNNGGVVTYNNHPQAWIGTRLHDTPGSERAFLVFSTKGGTGVGASDVPLERMCIDPVDGLVGIGTTNPQVLLDVYTSDDDTARFESTSTSRSTVSIRSGSTGDAQVRFQNGAASKWSIGNDGGDSNKFKIAVGSGAFAASEAVILDTSGNLSILGTLTEASSLALKENIEDFTPSLDIINKIRPVKYNKKKESKKEIGLIAEELAELFPELVDRDNQGNPSGVNYSRAVTVLLGGFKELYKEIEELKKRI